MKAFNFLFFGNIESPSSVNDDYYSYINTRGIRNGKYSFYCELTLSDSEDIYIITRKCVAKHGVVIPESNTDMVVELYVNMNGSILASDEAERVVRSIMPEEISRFFLFDAEMLQDYSVLLRTDSGSSTTVGLNLLTFLYLLTITERGVALGTSTATAYKYSVAGHLSFGAPK